MFADACMELEMLEGKERMAAEMARRDPKDSEWRRRNAHSVRMDENPEAALVYLVKEREAFEDDAVHQCEIAGPKPTLVQPCDHYSVPMKNKSVPVGSDGTFAIDGTYRAYYFVVKR
jgi:hypothetical protein|tara:strand:- start:544 stop:894 length:351 start_codon:yes stop_codon:yes gene_type:complete